MLDTATWDPQSPKRLEDIVGNNDMWGTLAGAIRSNTCPHIILCGPPGSGKSLFTHIVLEKSKRFPLLRIECTANSGLRDLRDAVRGFARGSRSVAGDYRWIVLEHADFLSGDTQAFLRRMMETTSNSTRFLFECSDAGTISEPILSRSTLYIVNAVSNSEMTYEIKRRTEFMLGAEEVNAIVSMTAGNMRNAVYMALAAKWNGDVYKCRELHNMYNELIQLAPKRGVSERDWVMWGIMAEKECRLKGLDCKNVLAFGWPKHPDVSYMLSQWSRLGGISSRALFFRAVHKLATTA